MVEISTKIGCSEMFVFGCVKASHLLFNITDCHSLHEKAPIISIEALDFVYSLRSLAAPFFWLKIAISTK